VLVCKAGGCPSECPLAPLVNRGHDVWHIPVLCTVALCAAGQEAGLLCTVQMPLGGGILAPAHEHASWYRVLGTLSNDECQQFWMALSGAVTQSQSGYTKGSWVHFSSDVATHQGTSSTAPGSYVLTQ
jgi:hypothetical protein